MTSACPCGSGNDRLLCCKPILGGQPAQSPEQLMRSRYSAYCAGLEKFLLATWHESTRPARIEFETGLVWRNLQVIRAETGNDKGSVSFIATWQQQSRWGRLQENARFVREAGQWFYVDGDVHHHDLAPGRNAPCPCGSGQKYKRCCCP